MGGFEQYLRVGSVIANITIILFLLYFLVPYIGSRVSKILNVEYYNIYEETRKEIIEYKYLSAENKLEFVAKYCILSPLIIILIVIAAKMLIMIAYPILLLGLLIHISILRQSKKLNNK